MERPRDTRRTTTAAHRAGHCPNRPPAGIGAGRLDGVAALSASNAWAVGGAINANHVSAPLIIHWNGRRWARVHAAPVPGHFYTELEGVAAASPHDAWAVGEAENGHRWSVAAGPLNGTSLGAITTDGHSLWAVGARDRSASRFVPLVQTCHQ